MNKKISGGLVLFNLNKGKEPTFLIAHPGGPFFKNRDDGWWSIPKGEPEANESIFEAAKREFEEETGMKPYGPYINLGDIVQKNGKKVFAWGFEGKWPTDKMPVCNHLIYLIRTDCLCIFFQKNAPPKLLQSFKSFFKKVKRD